MIHKATICAVLATMFTFNTPTYAQDFEFDGDDLPLAWSVTRPDPESYIVENSELLIVTSAVGSFPDETATNVFEYALENPGGDWTAEMVLNAEIQTSREALYLGVANEKGASIFANLHSVGDKYYGWSLMVGMSKNSSSGNASFSKAIASLGCNTCGESQMFPNFAQTLQFPITFQLVKKGRHYHARAKLFGATDEWVETEKVTLLRAAPKLVLYAAQYEETSGETLFLIDSLKITPN